MSKRTAIGLLAAISVIGATGSVFFFIQFQRAQNSQEAAQKKIIQRISSVVALPDATPTAVTVTDKTKLGNKLLAARVENQDMLLIYSDAKRIVIYRPGTKKVIDLLTFEASSSLPATR